MIIVVYVPGWALKCFSCNSNSNPACNDPVNIDKMPLTDCNVPPGTTASQTAACMKMHTEGKTPRSWWKIGLFRDCVAKFYAKMFRFFNKFAI